MNTTIKNGFNYSPILRWRGVVVYLPSCTWQGDPFLRVTFPESSGISAIREEDIPDRAVVVTGRNRIERIQRFASACSLQVDLRESYDGRDYNIEVMFY